MQKKNETPTISRRSFLKGMAASAVGVAAMGILGCSDPAANTTAAQTNAPETTKAPETTAAPQPQVTPVTASDVKKYEVIDSDHFPSFVLKGNGRQRCWRCCNGYPGMF